MGIVNITPDSFSDGGLHYAHAAAVGHARKLIDEGADLIDLGAESSRPGARPIDAEEELRRLLPVLQATERFGVPISVDTTKPAVMRAAVEHGAAMVNDITALAAPGALATVAASDVAVCLMHMQGEPRTMQREPRYDDVVKEVREFLAERVAACEGAGIVPERIAVDPGFGFGKTMEDNVALLRRLDIFADLGAGVLAGWSRKSSLSKITGRDLSDPLPASLAAAILAAQHGAAIVRVHDVAATRDVLAVLAKVERR